MAERARELDEQIARLNRMRAGLRHASTCRHTPLVECPHLKRARDDDAEADGQPTRSLAMPEATRTAV
jgi:hypothetical protein